MEPSKWAWSIDHRQTCRIVEVQDLWGETTCRVWLPGRDSVVRIPASRLKSLESAGTGSPDDKERTFQEQLDQKAHAYPEMVPLLVIRVEGGGHE
ncbi:MAG: hypothetical protein ABIF19_20585 [Planctomycetota bacterium]